jgi:TRAP-type C4-dicarboxylate transport system permease small subunit
MDDKLKDDAEETDGKEPEEEKSTKSSVRGKTKPSVQKKKRVDKDDEDEDDEDDEDEDDEDEDDEDEDDEDEDDEEDEDEEDEEEEQPKPPKKAVKPKKVTGVTGTKATAKQPKPVVKLPSELPLPPRNSEIMTGLVLAIAGYLAFWYGWSVYSLSIEKRHVSFFSNSAWAFLIAFFLVIMAALYFVRRERKEPDGQKTPDARNGSYRTAPEGKVAQSKPARVDRLGVLLAVLICGPFYGVYWWKAHTIWNSMYASESPVMWVIYAAALAIMSLGVFHGLRPPTEAQEKMRRIPGRRILLLLMSPFALVYGMIYLAGLHPPWP